MFDRLKIRIALYVMDAIEEYVAEHGKDMLEQAMQYLRSLLTNDGQVFSNAPPLAGCEDWCERQRTILQTLREEED